MEYRRFGRTDWSVSEVGYGMWGLAGWTGSEDAQTRASLERALVLGCTFFDTAFAYGDGHSETLLGALVRDHPEKRIYVASKIPPKNRIWPSRRDFALTDVFPAAYIREMTHRSLENLGLDRIDLQQFHVWEDAWSLDESWQRAIDDLKREGVVGALGVSVNRWEPYNGMGAVLTGQVDAVQVIYNLFDQSPEDALFPLCREKDVAVIARVPFDEGTLTGTLSLDSRWPEGDWRNGYFNPENLRSSVEHAERLRADVPAGMTMPELALRWILQNPDVSTVIPGMRQTRNVEANCGASGRPALEPGRMRRLRSHRWDRVPTSWSQ
jgi:aryl-alcohol dehydrogenase-like predicted oxidoreductase